MRHALGAAWFAALTTTNAHTLIRAISDNNTAQGVCATAFGIVCLIITAICIHETR